MSDLGIAAGRSASRPGAALFSAAARRVVEDLNRRTPEMTWSVSRIEGDRQVHLHVAGELVTPGQTVDWDDTFCRRMYAGSAHIVPDTSADDDYTDLLLSDTVRGYAGMPIVGPDEELFGVLCGVQEAPLPPDFPIDEGGLRLVSGLLADVLRASRMADDSASAERAAREEALTDTLTGLPNRRGWDRALDKARSALEAYGDPLSVVVLDLDNLKDINDESGHAAGDDTIRAVAAMLRTHVRRDDVVARIGGDEFGLLMVGEPEPLARRRLQRLRVRLEADGFQVSMGLGMATRATEFAVVVAAADRAMYTDKSLRRASSRSTG